MYKLIGSILVLIIFASPYSSPTVFAENSEPQAALSTSFSRVADTLTVLISSIADSFLKLSADNSLQIDAAHRAAQVIQSIQSQAEELLLIVKGNETATGDTSQVSQGNGLIPIQLSQTLGIGSSGDDVLILQEYLASLPEIYPEKLITGYYGPLTESAVRKYQNSAGLETVGNVGPLTLALINKGLLENSTLHVSFPPNFNLRDYTVSLLNMVNEHRLAAPAQKKSIAVRLANFAKLRKNAVLLEIKNNPNLVLESAFPSHSLQFVPPEILINIEQRKSIKGKFEYIHIHNGDFTNGTVEDQLYVIENGTNKKYRIYSTGEVQALTDDVVSVDGVVVDNQIATKANLIEVISSANKIINSQTKNNFGVFGVLFAKISDVFQTRSVEAQANPNLKKVAVIMFNWQDDTRTPWTDNSARGAYFTNSNSANAYFQEVSFGKIEMVGKIRPDGDVFDWVTLPYNKGTSCNYSTWGNDAKNILQSQGIDLSGYDVHSFVFPNGPCSWLGVASVGGNPARSYMNGSIGARVVFHELGHNWGSHHSSTWSCTENSVRVSISSDSNCVLSEYGDPFDIMGAATSLHINNYHKGITNYSLNWLDPINTLTVDRFAAPDATYLVEPIEWATSGIQALRIPKDTSSNGTPTSYYYIEFRQPFGFDNFSASSPAVNGVSIRVASGYNSTVKSKLIDATPGTSSFNDAPLAVGKTFTDPYKSINVTTLSTSAAGAQVRVFFGALPCIRSNPSLNVNPTSVSVFAGQSASLSYTLTNNDTSTCPTSDFKITPNLPTGFTQSPSTVNHQLSGGGSANGSFIVSTPTNASTALHTVLEVAQNIALPAYNSTSSITVNVLPPDTTPPTVAIISPPDGSIFSKGNITVDVSASDQSGISEINIFVDGGLIATCYGSLSCNTRVNSKQLTTGTHIITAQAVDSGGPIANSSSVSISIEYTGSSSGGGGGGGGPPKGKGRNN